MTDMTAEQALDAVRNVLRRAYNSAVPVCCGRAGTECCGSPEPEWSEYDQQIINDLQPVEEYLRQALTAPRVPDGWKPVPRHPDGGMGEAAYDVEMKALHHGEPASFIDVWQAMYDAAPMLTAAPAHPAGRQEQGEMRRLREALETIAAYPYSRDQEMGATAMRKVARDALAATRGESNE